MPMTPMRAASWWIHWKDLDWPTQDTCDRIRRRADEFARANVNTAMIFGTHFRWDYLPFFTQIHDYMATVAEELHQRNIRLFDHHSAVFVHRYDSAQQMRDIKRHCGPHLPFCPDSNAAASWQYQGKYLNDWRRIDAFTRKVYYSKQYYAEKFCLVNPDFLDAYTHYLRRLIKDTKIDGLMSDDANFGMFCACPACQQRFFKRTGKPFPAPDDHRFWGNWDNQQWLDYLDDRFQALAEFYRRIRQALPAPDFPLTSCCSSVCADDNVMSALSLEAQLQGCTFANHELVGNTPLEPQHRGEFIDERVVTMAFHAAVTRPHNCRTLTIGYGFIPDNANALWSLAKAMGSDCWFSTLKDRLGLPDSILDTLPGDAEPATQAFAFEKKHPELFQGTPFYRCAVFFSEETRRHTAFGSYARGYTEDFKQTLTLLFHEGLMPAVTLQIPAKSQDIPLLVIPSAIRLTQQQRKDLQHYQDAGGKIVAFGPSGLPGAPDWQPPTRPQGDIRKSWGEWPQVWGGELPPVNAKPAWNDLTPTCLYHPWRLRDHPGFSQELATRIRTLAAPFPAAEVVSAQGFFLTAFRTPEGVVRLFFTADTYDTKINQHLNDIRFHHSRVHLFTQAPPCGQSGAIDLKLLPGWTIRQVICAPDDLRPEASPEGHITLERPVCSVIVELAQGD